MAEKNNSFIEHYNDSYSIYRFNKTIQYIYEYKVDNKIVDKRKTNDFEVWYDKITDRIYELNRFKEIEIKIQVCNS
ncbi:MAG: hypothetical protein ACFFG0_32275 [Candidatus Thorarchaeota archaeon]